MAGPSGATWTFSELNMKANAVASRLAEYVQMPISTVAIVVHKPCVDAFAAYLGVLKFGATVLVLDADSSADELRGAKTWSISVVLTSSLEAGVLRNLDAVVPTLLISFILSEQKASGDVKPLMELGDAILQLGRNGEPSVATRHETLVDSLLAASEKVMLLAGVDTAALGSDLSDITAVYDMFLAWCAGVPLVLPRSGNYLSETELKQEAITFLRCQPNFLRKQIPADFPLPLLRVLVSDEAPKPLVALRAKWAVPGRHLFSLGSLAVTPASMPLLTATGCSDASTEFNQTEHVSSVDTPSRDDDARSSHSQASSGPQQGSVLFGGELSELTHVPHLSKAVFLHDIFELSVSKWPDRPCFSVAGDGVPPLTYSELNTLAMRVACNLGTYVKGPDAVVAVVLKRDSAAAFAALLGVWKAGAAALMIDKSTPLALQAHMISEAGPIVVIGEDVAEASCRVLSWEHAVAAGDPHLVPAAPDWLHEDSAAVVLFTSGSTGKPKGLRNAHRSYVHFHRHNAELLRLPGEGFAVSQMAKFGFDVSLREMFMPWCVGARLCVLPDVMTTSGTALPDVWAQEGIGAMCGVPSLFSAVETIPASVRVTYLAGEPVSPDVLQLLSGEGRVIVNGYGTSETPMSVCRMVYRGNAKPTRHVTIGRPVPGSSVAVLDGLRIVPMGQVGEICVGGMQLTLGYIDAAKNAVSLIQHPELGQLYRTGDLGRVGPDGVEFFGRNDDQVKIAGNRLELASVDIALREVWRGDALAKVTAGGQLVGFLEARKEESLAAEEDPALQTLSAERTKALQIALAAVLPRYAVPSRLFVLAEMPRTAVSRKLSRKMLPEPMNAVATGLADANNEVEAWVLKVAWEVWQDHTLRLDDELTACGGSSITIARFAKALRCSEIAPINAQARATLTMRQLLGAGTLRQLSSELLECQGCQDTALGAPSSDRSSEADALRSCEPGLRQERELPRAAFTALQLLWLLLNVSLLTNTIAGIYRCLGHWHLRVLKISMAASCTFPLMLVWTVAMVRLLLGVGEGLYPMFGKSHLKFWCSQKITSPVLHVLLALKLRCLLRLFLRCLGARVGDRISWPCKVQLSGVGHLDIGDDCIIEHGAALEAVAFVRDGLLVSPIQVKDRVKLGVYSYLAPGTVLGEDCEVATMAAIVTRVTSPPNVRWEGVPATARARAPEQVRQRLRQAAAESASAWAPLVEWLLWGGALLTRRFVGLAPALCLVWHQLLHGFALLEAGQTLSSAFLGELMIRVCLATWLKNVLTGVTAVVVCRCLPRVAPGTYARNSVTVFVAQYKIDLFEEVQKTYASSPFLPYWFAAMGVKIYPLVGNLEFGRMSGILPDAFSIAACNSSGANTIGNSVETTQEGVLIRQTTLTQGCFVGNNAFVAPSIYQNDLMIGVAANLAPGSFYLHDDAPRRPLTVFGNPPVQIPRAPEKTKHAHEPAFANFLFRVLCTELARGFAKIPLSILPMLLIGWAACVYRTLRPELRVPFLLVAPPLVCLTFWVTLFVLFFCAKWTIVGRAKESTHGMWDCFVQQNFFMWRIWGWVQPTFFLFSGSPAFNFVLRALGAHVGEGALVANQNRYFDVDLLHIGAKAVVSHVKWQLHTFEDGVLKLYPARIGDNALVTHAAVVGGAGVGDGATLLPGSCVMKGEELAAGKVYVGAPVAQVSGCPSAAI